MRRRQNRCLNIVDKSIGLRSEGDFEKRLAKWRRDFESALLDAHKKAAELGRRRAGNNRNAPRKDERLAKRVMRGEQAFLDGFEKSIREGAYGEPRSLDTEAIDRRMFMYLDKARATANEAFGENSKPSEWDRIMLAAEHCGTCPPKARRYPNWEAVKAAGIPADGSDECLTKCECVLHRVSDSRIGFATVFEKPKPLMTPEGFVPEDVYLPPGKVKYFVTPREKDDKSNYFKLAGFDQSNINELRDAILKFGKEFKLMEVERSKNGRRFISIGRILGPNGESIRIQATWQFDGRRGLKLTTMFMPRKGVVKVYEEWLKVNE
ncbi:MAG: hypothetical protein JST12_14665 [Armatimonadetes bacterium]|nr:hypothetical protein [Armatimonadota bacterium]